MNKKDIICYGSDSSRIAGKVEKVIFPRTVEDVQRALKANDRIVPRGAGTSLVGGCVPNDSAVLEMSKMNSVLNFDPVRNRVSVEAGITVKELNEKLRARGFEFPIELSNRGISTIGGMIATNASGCRTVKYGKIKEWIEEVQFVNGRGEIMKLGKTDLDDVCGMEGITGVIVSAKLRIIPYMKRTASIFQTEDLEELLAISRRLKLEKEVCMLEMFPKKVSVLLGLPEKYHLLVEFDSERGKIKGEEYQFMSELKNRVYFLMYSEGYYESEDPRLFSDKLEEFMTLLEKEDIPYFAFLGEGVVHPFFREDDSKKKNVLEFIKKSRTKPGKYGIGISRKYFLDGFETKIFQRVKLRHDPFGKMNPGKIIDAEKRSFQPDLKKDIPEEEIEEQQSEEDSSCLAGESLSAAKILDELKTPSEKMEELIKEAKKTDEKSEIEKRLKDYEYIYDSEPSEEKKSEVEQFARDITREISERPSKERPVSEDEAVKRIIASRYPQKPAEEINSENKNDLDRKSNRDVDYKKIQDIMTNKFWGSKKEEKDEHRSG